MISIHEYFKTNHVNLERNKSVYVFGTDDIQLNALQHKHSYNWIRSTTNIRYETNANRGCNSNSHSIINYLAL